jgi:hypothetical protein
MSRPRACLHKLREAGVDRLTMVALIGLDRRLHRRDVGSRCILVLHRLQIVARVHRPMCGAGLCE